MGFKRTTWAFFNLFFIGVFAVALWVLFFNKNKDFDAHQIVEASLYKEKTFAAFPKEITLSNGLKAWFLQENSAPLVALDFYFDKAGFAFDDENQKGMAVFAAAMLSKRAADMDDEAFQNMLNENAIDIQIKASDDIFEITLTTPKANIETASMLLNAVLTAPNTNQNDAEVTRRKQLMAIYSQNENPEAVISQKFKEKLFGSHPKARLSIGVKEDVEKLKAQDVASFVSQHLRKNNVKIALAGDLSEDESVAFLNKVFDGLPDFGEDVDLPLLAPNFDAKEENIERNMPQVISFFASPGTARLDQDFYALYIANEIFGGAGLSSRLNLRAREKEGLTYGAYTYLDADKEAPMIVGTFSSSKENYEKMRAILLEEWHKMATQGVSQKEFEAVKNNMLSAFNLRFSSLEQIATQLLYMQKENLGLDFFQKRNEYVSNVSFDEVNAAAKKYFKNNPFILTIGNNKNGEN